MGRRKQGVRVTIYFTDADEDMVDGIVDDIEEGRLKDPDGKPYKSFSDFVRKAVRNQLERSSSNDAE